VIVDVTRSSAYRDRTRAVIILSGTDSTMTTSLNEKVSSEKRKDIWVELQSLRQDTQALRAEAYRLRIGGRLDATANERLRTQQTDLERRGEAIIKRCVHLFTYFSGPDLEGSNRLSPELEWPTGRGSGT